MTLGQTKKLLTLPEIAGKVALYAQAMLEMCGHEGVGHIVILVSNAAEGGSDQVTATNVPAEEVAQFLRFIADEFAAGVPPVGEISHD